MIKPYKIILCSLFICTSVIALAKVDTLDIGSQKQIFIDDYLFETSSNLQLRMNPPYQDNVPVIIVDQPWEQAAEARIHAAYASVIQENGMVRIWYTLMTNDPENALCVCYAESKDGIHFEKPALNLIELNGSKENNIVIPGTVGGTAVWIDPKAPPQQRYKTQARNYKPKACFKMHASPDGIHWTLIGEVDIEPHDTQNIIFWDEQIHRYVLYGRELVPYQTTPKKLYYRQVRRLESDDLAKWDSYRIVLEADDEDLNMYSSPTVQPPMDYYGGVVFNYPDPLGPYFMFAHTFWHWKRRLPTESRNIFPDADKKIDRLSPGTFDVRLVVSRDGKTFHQFPDRDPFMSLGLEGSTFSRMIWAAPNPIQRGEELWIYYNGKNSDHEFFLEPNADTDKSGIARAVLRLDGFTSIDANFKGGLFTTKPLRFTGSKLYLNINASAGGSAIVELLDINGNPLKGFTKEEAQPLYGNSTHMPVQWNNNPDLKKLNGQPVKIRISIKSTKLYAFQFTD